MKGFSSTGINVQLNAGQDFSTAPNIKYVHILRLNLYSTLAVYTRELRVRLHETRDEFHPGTNSSRGEM